MAIAFDASANGGDTSGSPLTFSHTCTGSDLYLIVGIAAAAFDSTGVTYNSVAMTLISRVNLTAVVDVRIELWGLIAPATGAHNVVVSWTGGSRNTSAVAHSWTGVDQTTPTGTAATTTQDSTGPTTISTNVSSASGEIVVDLMTCYNQTPTKGGSQTLISNFANGAGAPNSGNSYRNGAPSTTMSWTWSSGMISAQIGVPLKPVAGTLPPDPSFINNVLRPRPFKPGLAR